MTDTKPTPYWQEEAKRYAVTAEYWRERAEKAEAELAALRLELARLDGGIPYGN